MRQSSLSFIKETKSINLALNSQEQLLYCVTWEDSHTHTHTFFIMRGTFHWLLLFLYWANNNLNPIILALNVTQTQTILLFYFRFSLWHYLLCLLSLYGAVGWKHTHLTLTNIEANSITNLHAQKQKST